VSQIESILTSIKKLLGITEEYTSFDDDIIMHINSVFSILNQLGINDSKEFKIEDKTTTWDEYVEDEENIQLVKSYMYLKIKIIFDPPTSGTVMDCYKQQIAEYEWRLMTVQDNKLNDE